MNTSNQPKCKVEDQQSCDAGYHLQGRSATRTTNKHAPAQCPLHCLPALCLLLGQSTHMLCTARQDVCSTGVPLLFTSASTNTTDTQLNQPYPPACRAALVPNLVSPASRLTHTQPYPNDNHANPPHLPTAGIDGGRPATQARVMQPRAASCSQPPRSGARADSETPLPSWLAVTLPSVRCVCRSMWCSQICRRASGLSSARRGPALGCNCCTRRAARGRFPLTCSCP